MWCISFFRDLNRVIPAALEDTPEKDKLKRKRNDDKPVGLIKNYRFYHGQELMINN